MSFKTVGNRLNFSKKEDMINSAMLWRNKGKTYPKWAIAHGDDLIRKVNRTLLSDYSIEWLLENETLPAFDHMEMSGKMSSHIISYKIDEKKNLELFRHCTVPTLRMLPDITGSSYSHNFDNSCTVKFKINEKESVFETLKITIRGIIKTKEKCGNIIIKRKMYPAMENIGLIEKIAIQNCGEEATTVESVFKDYLYKEKNEACKDGVFISSFKVIMGENFNSNEKNANINAVLKRGEKIELYVVYYSIKEGDALVYNLETEFKKREKLIQRAFSYGLRIESSNKILNAAFSYFTLRTLESIFYTKNGYMHGPGGGNYYAALWTNDQCEYANPFFAYAGYDLGVEQSINCYRLFAEEMDKRDIPFKEKITIPTSIAAQGDVVWNGAGDRGDAAMYGSGAARFALTVGNLELAKELYENIKWCIDFSLSRMNKRGVIESDSDELELRFKAGKSNLFTNCNTYDMLNSAAMLAEVLGENEDKIFYENESKKLKENIINYFKGKVKGYQTYKYYKTNRVLRSWICVPMTMGIFERSEETIKALFSKKLYNNGYIKTASNNKVCWDRSLAYALRGAFYAGGKEDAYAVFMDYLSHRILGNHVPYAIEAYPEGNRCHLSADNTLMARVFIEGIIGFRPIGFKKFLLKINIPSGIEYYNVKSLKIANVNVDILITKEKLKIIFENKEITLNYKANENITIDLNSF